MNTPTNRENSPESTKKSLRNNSKKITGAIVIMVAGLLGCDSKTTNTEKVGFLERNLNSMALPENSYMIKDCVTYQIIYKNTVQGENIEKDDEYVYIGEDKDFGAIYGKPMYPNQEPSEICLAEKHKDTI